MKRLVAIAMFAALLMLETSASSQQNQPPPRAQSTPPNQSAPSTQPQTEPSPAPPPAQTPVPPQEQNAAPIGPQTQPAPGPAPQPETPPPATQSSHTPKSTKIKKPPTKTPAPSGKVVVRNGGAKDSSAQLAPGMSKEQELHNRENTSRLLATTDANLKAIANLQLTPAQQGLLDQIHSYIRQSKEASDSGDLARAHTLAYKAHLLSDELTRK